MELDVSHDFSALSYPEKLEDLAPEDYDLMSIFKARWDKFIP